MCVLVVQLCPTLCNPMVCPWDSPGKSTGVGCHSLLEGILLTQGLNPRLLHCRQILYHLSYQGNPQLQVGSTYYMTEMTLYSQSNSLREIISISKDETNEVQRLEMCPKSPKSRNSLALQYTVSSTVQIPRLPYLQAHALNYPITWS